MADEDVAGLEVPVDDATRVQVIHASTDPANQRQQLDGMPLDRPTGVVQHGVERASRAVLHDQVHVLVVLAQGAERDNVVVVAGR